MEDADSGIVERLDEVRDRLRKRDLILLGPVSLAIVVLVLMTSAYVIGGPPSGFVSAENIEAYRRDADESEHQGCPSDEHREAATAGDGRAAQARRDERDDHASDSCLARLALRESVVANRIAHDYNVISDDAARWAKFAGVLVAVVGVTSVVGVVVAVFAASDARRAIDAGLATNTISRNASRAYVHLVRDESGPWPIRMVNAGASPAAVTGIRASWSESDDARMDPSVIRWEHLEVRHDTLASGAEAVVMVPFTKAGGRSQAMIVGVDFNDVHGGRWCSWRRFIFDARTGDLRLDRAGEFPMR